LGWKPRLQIFLEPSTARSLESRESQETFQLGPIQDHAFKLPGPRLYGEVMTDHPVVLPAFLPMRISFGLRGEKISQAHAQPLPCVRGEKTDPLDGK
jgi:hypothetical protein